ncbi:hypothetical protein QCD60_12265 [Pokkaliibacter sp. MBI-7]|uniref:DUF2917 domain-containing protein n=1 Tax=Proteobacteria bacterium 228 TaxID=2083153 RepID=A0A2S5KPB9_9PROT|nr:MULTISPECIES: hypothetical protein [Pokkaliibacter]MDH2433345.1 hypothetical protein [Pokkaliibacter sp. MBI-7]PPC76572.1 hypothetical protein C4K68_14920 [Pokkaliibacter plantistimulans]
MSTLNLQLNAKETLVLELHEATEVRLISGEHWLSLNGKDITLDSNATQHSLPAGKLIIEGEGVLTLKAQATYKEISGWRHLLDQVWHRTAIAFS